MSLPDNVLRAISDHVASNGVSSLERALPVAAAHHGALCVTGSVLHFSVMKEGGISEVEIPVVVAIGIGKDAEEALRKVAELHPRPPGTTTRKVEFRTPPPPSGG